MRFMSLSRVHMNNLIFAVEHYSTKGSNSMTKGENLFFHISWKTYWYIFKNYRNNFNVQFSSVQFSRSVVSDSLRPHESQYARPPCPSLSPGVQSDSHPSSLWCHPAISSWVIPFSSCPQSLPASESFPMSQLFAWGGQSTGASALASFLPRNPRVVNKVKKLQCKNWFVHW